MATPLSADRIVKALRDEGLTVHEYKSWRIHNRNHIGAWGPVNGVMIHHTVTRADSGTVQLCYYGYSGLPGPLCLGVITKDGHVWLVGNGRANHAGSGDDDVLNAVIREDSTLPPPNERNTDGNARFYGFECVNLGDGKDPWPAVQLEAIEKASAALCRAHGWGHNSVIGHKEWSYTKIDPKGFSMEGMRDRVKSRLAGNPPKPPQEEDDVALSSDDLSKIRSIVREEARLNTADVKSLAKQDDVIRAPSGQGDNTHWTMESYLYYGYEEVQEVLGRVAALESRLDEVLSALSGMDPDSISGELVRTLQEKLNSMNITFEE